MGSMAQWLICEMAGQKWEDIRSRQVRKPKLQTFGSPIYFIIPCSSSSSYRTLNCSEKAVVSRKSLHDQTWGQGQCHRHFFFRFYWWPPMSIASNIFSFGQCQGGMQTSSHCALYCAQIVATYIFYMCPCSIALCVRRSVQNRWVLAKNLCVLRVLL